MTPKSSLSFTSASPSLFIRKIGQQKAEERNSVGDGQADNDEKASTHLPSSGQPGQDVRGIPFAFSHNQKRLP